MRGENATSKSEQAKQDDLLQTENVKLTKRISKKQRIKQKLELAERSPTQPEEPITRSNKRITYYVNNLDRDERKRDDVGTAINLPFFVEEFRAIQAAYDKNKNSAQASSFTDYIRQVLKDHAKKALGASEYQDFEDEKLNQIVEPLPPKSKEDDTDVRSYAAV